jgi:plastocyanin
LYRFWVFVHILGVFGFLLFHGVSVVVTFRLRTERDPRRINDLLALSGSSISAFYASLAVLLLGGVVAGFLGDWWGRAWIWVAIVLLVATSVAMFLLARPYYRRIGLVARAMAGGSEAVTEDQFDAILRSRRPWTIVAIGFGGLLAILYLMMFKPSFDFSGGPAEPTVPPGTIAITANTLAFDTSELAVPAGEPFEIFLNNEESGVPHNLSIYTDSSAATPLFVGENITGPATITYQVEALDAGEYFFRCDVHPVQMVGTVMAAGRVITGTDASP